MLHRRPALIPAHLGVQPHGKGDQQLRRMLRRIDVLGQFLQLVLVQPRRRLAKAVRAGMGIGQASDRQQSGSRSLYLLSGY